MNVTIDTEYFGFLLPVKEGSKFRFITPEASAAFNNQNIFAHESDSPGLCDIVPHADPRGPRVCVSFFVAPMPGKTPPIKAVRVRRAW